jgi:hypothetical protein
VSDKTFSEGCDELRLLVGSGHVGMSVTVDQVYAQNQHQSVWFRHPHGGQALYLYTPLMLRYSKWLENIARRLLDEGPIPGMVKAADDLVSGVEQYAPRDLGYLRRSGAARVTDDGSTVYDKAALVSRLSNEELKALGRFEDGG